MRERSGIRCHMAPIKSQEPLKKRRQRRSCRGFSHRRKKDDQWGEKGEKRWMTGTCRWRRSSTEPLPATRASERFFQGFCAGIGSLVKRSAGPAQMEAARKRSAGSLGSGSVPRSNSGSGGIGWFEEVGGESRIHNAAIGKSSPEAQVAKSAESVPPTRLG